MGKLFNKIIYFQQLWLFFQQCDIAFQQSAKHLNFDILFLEVDLMYGTSFNHSLNNFDALFWIKIQISIGRPCPKEQHAHLLPKKVVTFFYCPKRCIIFWNVYTQTIFRFFKNFFVEQNFHIKFLGLERFSEKIFRWTFFFAPI